MVTGRSEKIDRTRDCGPAAHLSPCSKRSPITERLDTALRVLARRLRCSAASSHPHLDLLHFWRWNIHLFNNQRV